MKKNVILLLITSSLMIGCNVTKSLETEVTVAIDNDFEVIIENKGKSEFSNKYSKKDYQDAFIKGLKSSLTLHKVKPVEAGLNPDFTLKITKLTIIENTSQDTVKNEKSPKCKLCTCFTYHFAFVFCIM